MILTRNCIAMSENIWLKARNRSIATSPTAWVMHWDYGCSYPVPFRRFSCFKYYYKEYVYNFFCNCSHVRYPNNRYVEMEKEVVLPLAIFHQESPAENLDCISFVDSTSLRVCRNHRSWFIRHSKYFPGMEDVPWDGYSDSSCFWQSMAKGDSQFYVHTWKRVWSGTVKAG